MSWNEVSLGELEGGKGNFVDGPFGSNLKASEYVETGVPIIQLKNIKPNQYIEKDLKFVTQDKADSLNRHSYQAGDVCIAKLGSVGTACIIPATAPNGVIVADVVRFRGDRTRIDYKYLCYFLNSVIGQQRILAFSRGSTRTRTNLGDLKKVKIPLPPLDEQKRIAAILDKADAIRQKRKQAIDLADEFLRSVFLDMFGDPVTNPKGWEVCELNRCLDFLTSGSRGWAKYYAEQGSKFIRIQNVGKNKLLLNELAYVNAPDTKEAERTRIKVNDVLLSITADLGRSAVVTEDLSGGHINQHLALLRLKKNKLEPQFLSALLSSEGALRQFKAKNKAAVKAGLNFDDIRSFEVYLPPLRTQSNYLAIYSAAMKNLNKLIIQRENAEALLSSLSQKAFSGQL